MDSYAFISYQTRDKQIARQVKDILASIGITSFMAHEDIDVSEEWRAKILEEISKAGIFVSILSQNYYSSVWCVQESGVAVFRDNMTIIPLSIDGSISQGFFSNIQSTKIEPEQMSLRELLPGLVKHNFKQAADEIIKLIGGSRSFRGAEANFQIILPYLDSLTPEQNKDLLERSSKNNQIHHASLCATEYLPLILKKHGHLLDNETRELLESVCEDYISHKREW